MQLPYLTSEFPGVGGTIRQRIEDFSVQELPLYEPSGQGEHVYCEIEKRGITVFQAVDRLAAALNVDPRDIGYAGLKDARAVTRQWLSILGTTEDAVMAAKVEGVAILWAYRHGNKLRLGHLSGNRFAIKIRDVKPTDVIRLPPIIEVIRRRGMPNFFGPQRFGRRGDNHLVGAALLRGDLPGVLKLLLGTPNPEFDDPARMSARQSFEAGDYHEAMRRWPREAGMERRVLDRFIKTKRPVAALSAVPERVRRLWISALQSEMFNQVLARRMDSLDRLMDGDLAEKSDNGAVFRVESAAVEQPRCDAFEISPTGPLVGFQMTLPMGRPLEIEEEIFAANSLKPSDFRVPGKHRVKGARRAMRVRPEDIDISAGGDEHGGYIAVAFTLSAGSFATVLLRELMKTEVEGEAAG